MWCITELFPCFLWSALDASSCEFVLRSVTWVWLEISDVENARVLGLWVYIVCEQWM